MTALCRFVATGLVAVASCAACSSPVVQAPAPVRAALDAFVAAGYSCAGPSWDHSAYGQWQCSLSAPDQVSYSVFVDANESGVKEVTALLDQSTGSPPNGAIAAAFFGKVTDINVGGSSSPIKAWVDSHIANGGQEHIGSVLVTLDRLRPVTHLVLFVSG